MTQATIELQLPPELLARAQEIAHANNQSLEDVLLESLSLLFAAPSAPLPALDALSAYGDAQLWAVVHRHLAWPQDARLHELIARGKAGALSPDERAEMESLLDWVDRYTLLRSQALVLLRQRGHEVERLLNVGA